MIKNILTPKQKEWSFFLKCVRKKNVIDNTQDVVVNNKHLFPFFMHTYSLKGIQ